MKVNVNYSDYLTNDGKKKIESYEAVVSENISMKFEVVRPDTDILVEPSCKVTLEDSITLDKIEFSIPQDEYRDFLQIIREISTQFDI